MTRLVIAAHADTERARFLYGHPTLCRSLVGYAAWALKNAFPGRTILLASDSKAVTAMGRELGLEVILDSGKIEDHGPGSTLILRPHRGPVSPERIRLVHQAARQNGQRSVSAMHVHVNCNPAWLMTLPQRTVDRDTATVEFSSQDVRPLQDRADGARSAKVVGSQWLPETHLADGAVAACPDSPRPGKPLWIKDDPLGHPETPLFYRLPLFWMDESTRPCLDLSPGAAGHKALAGMFAPYDPGPAGNLCRVVNG